MLQSFAAHFIIQFNIYLYDFLTFCRFCIDTFFRSNGIIVMYSEKLALQQAEKGENEHGHNE